MIKLIRKDSQDIRSLEMRATFFGRDSQVFCFALFPQCTVSRSAEANPWNIQLTNKPGLMSSSRQIAL